MRTHYPHMRKVPGNSSPYSYVCMYVRNNSNLFFLKSRKMLNIFWNSLLNITVWKCFWAPCLSQQNHVLTSRDSHVSWKASPKLGSFLGNTFPGEVSQGKVEFQFRESFPFHNWVILRGVYLLKVYNKYEIVHDLSQSVKCRRGLVGYPLFHEKLPRERWHCSFPDFRLRFYFLCYIIGSVTSLWPRPVRLGRLVCRLSAG